MIPLRLLPASLFLCLVLVVPCVAQGLNPANLAGTWLYQNQTEAIQLVLNQNGSYQVTYATAQGSEQEIGMWQCGGSVIVFQAQNEQPEQYPATLQDQNTLVITLRDEAGNPLQLSMQRMGGAVQQPTQQYPGGQQYPNQPYATPTQPATPQTPQYQQPGQYNQPQYPQQYPQQYQQPQQQPIQQPMQQNAALGALPQTMVFRPYLDKSEEAFTVLVPEGWYVKGGILRVDPGQAGGPANSLEAKIDFSLHKDQQSSVGAWILPTYYFTTMGGTMVQSMYPEGSYYYGMEVRHLMDPVEFAVVRAFPYAHPNAGQPQVVVQRELPELAKAYRDNATGVAKGSFVYKAGMVELRYQENGVDYQERMAVVIEDRGYAVAGQWANPLTLAVRAPWGQLDAWEPVFRTISDSFHIRVEWLAKELRSQIQTGGMIADVEAEAKRIDADITKHRQKTNAAINQQMYLNLTGQENYVDPDTGEVQQASNAWQHRMKAPDGSYVYTNDPEAMRKMQIEGYKETMPKQPEVIN